MNKNDFVKTTVEVVGDMAVTYLLTCVGGQIIKTAVTAKKLHDCGKGAKMTYEFTKNAQKTNIIKTIKKATIAGGTKIATDITGKILDKNKNDNQYTNNYNYNGFYTEEGIKTVEEECINRIKMLMSIGNWTIKDAIDYTMEKLYKDYPEPIAKIKAVEFVNNIK